MSDVELLFLVLALIYASECLCWLPSGSQAFVSWFASRWGRAQPFVRNERGGFVLAPFLPPLGNILQAAQWPIAISSEGFVPLSRPAGNAFGHNVIKFEQIQNVKTEAKKLIVNGRAVVRASSPTQAWRVAELLRELQKLPSASREKALQKILQDRFRTKSIRERWNEFSAQTANLQILTNALFVYLFIFAPLTIWRVGLASTWATLLAGLYVLTFTIAFLFRATHKHFYPAVTDERFTHVLINMFSPASTIRARDLLSRPLLEDFHPLAISKVFFSEDQFKAMAKAALLDLRFPAKSTSASPNPAEQKVMDFFTHLQNSAVEEFLKQCGLKLDDLLQPPKRMDESCHSYCPRCQSQFTFVEGECADCGGLKAISFDKQNKPVPARV